MNNEQGTFAERWSRMGQFTFWFLQFALIILIGWWNLLRPEGTLIVILLLAAAGAVWLGVLWRNDFKMPATPLDAALLFLLAVVLFTSWVALDPSRSWRMAWQWIACAFFFYIAVTLLRNQWSPYIMASALLLVLSIAAVGAYIQLYQFLISWYAAGPWPTFSRPISPD